MSAARILTPQHERRAAFAAAVAQSNDIDALVACQAEAYLQARVYGVGSVTFEMEMPRVALNERRRRVIAEGRDAA